MVLLKVKKREGIKENNNQLRKEDIIPGIVYGKNLKATEVMVGKRAFQKVYDEAGENAMIDLDFGDKATKQVIIRETQLDPLSGEFIHVDFFAPRMDKKIEAQLELDYIGESPAVRELGGIFVKSIDKLEIRCLPKDLPDVLKVDISGLKQFDDTLKIKDLKISDKVEVIADPETVIAVVTPPRSEEELKGLEEKVEEDVSKVEVTGEKKEEEEAAPEGETSTATEVKPNKSEEKK